MNGARAQRRGGINREAGGAGSQSFFWIGAEGGNQGFAIAAKLIRPESLRLDESRRDRR
jgi:hypothetical protein